MSKARSERGNHFSFTGAQELKKESTPFLSFEVSRPARKRHHRRDGILSRIPPLLPGGGRRCSRPGAASAAGSSGLVVRELSVGDGLSRTGVVFYMNFSYSIFLIQASWILSSFVKVKFLLSTEEEVSL